MRAEYLVGPPRVGRSAVFSMRRTKVVGLIAVVVWMLWASGLGRRQLLNSGGWSFIRQFFAASIRPELSTSFLRDLGSETLTTVGFAVLGTLLAVVIGLVFGLATSATLWKANRTRSVLRGAGWRLSRLGLSVPRGIHEIVWGLFFVGVLGANPLVAILALGIPFGAITAKVYAELIDDASTRTFSTLTASGAPSFASMLYGIFPTIIGDVVSYAFYRLECAIRSAAVVGFIGAGGLGFRLSQSNSGNNYREVWTILYILVALCVVGERWSALVRRSDRRSVVLSSLAVGTALSVWSWWHLGVQPATLWSERSREQFSRVASSAWPPQLPAGRWSELFTAAKTTLEMSILAMLIAVSAGAVLAIAGSRRHGNVGVLHRTLRSFVRLVVLIVRAVPVTLWALLVLFVVLPGIVPGAVALGVYTTSVLARLFGEVLENDQPGPKNQLCALGASDLSSFVYGSLPNIAPGWASAALYRWEVTARETVVVGMVGAGGLGRVLQAQLSSFDYRPLFTTMVCLILLTVFVDAIAGVVRRSLR